MAADGGLVRDRVLAHTLGLSPAAGAFRAALRIPNLLQNLLGEGVLSASFIPVYARLCAEGRTEDASRVARAIGTLLALVASAMALGGVLAARALVELLAPGFHDDARALTIRLVQILFPGVALLVMSAWCLGVLNSHRRFFLSYVSPVVWNAALIGAAIAAGTGSLATTATSWRGSRGARSPARPRSSWSSSPRRRGWCARCGRRSRCAIRVCSRPCAPSCPRPPRSPGGCAGAADRCRAQLGRTDACGRPVHGRLVRSRSTEACLHEHDQAESNGSDAR